MKAADGDQVGLVPHVLEGLDDEGEPDDSPSKGNELWTNVLQKRNIET